MFRKISLGLTLVVSLHATETKLDTIIVSSTNYEDEILKDEIKNVVVIKKEDIENRGYNNIKEVLEKAPSITLYDGMIDMRGQGKKANTSVKIMLNGIGINTMDKTQTLSYLNLIPIENIEKIEILPGGGAVLYGSGTAGGSINIITKSALVDPYALLSTKLGSYNYKDINLGVGGKLTDDLSIKFNNKLVDTNGYRKEYKEKNEFASLGLNYQINENQSLSFYEDYSQSKTKSVSSLSTEQVKADRRQSGNTRQKAYSNDKRYTANFDYILQQGDWIDLRITPWYQTMSSNNDSKIDYRKGINIKNRSDYGMGALYYGYEFDWDKADTYAKAKGSSSIQSSKLRKYSNSIFLLDKNDFNDYLGLSLGARYQRDEFDVGDVKRDLTFKRNDNHYAFSFTPNYKYSDSGFVYIGLERGYVSPASNNIYNGINHKYDGGKDELVYELNDIKPETFLTYEIGLRDQFSDNITLNATTFLTYKKNEIAIHWTKGFYFVNDGWVYANLEKTKRVGLELTAKQSLLNDNLNLTQSYFFIKPTILKGEYKGREVPNVPNHKIVLGANYKIIKPLSVYLDFIYYSSKYEDYPNIQESYAHGWTDKQTKAKGYNLVNLGASYNIYNGFEVSTGIKNLFNEKYFTYSKAQSNSRSQANREIYVVGSYDPAPERNYYLEFKYKY